MLILKSMRRYQNSKLDRLNTLLALKLNMLHQKNKSIKNHLQFPQLNPPNPNMHLKGSE